MKKIFVAVMAMAAFAACSTEEQIAAPKGQAIAFGDAFVDNATKAIYEGGAVPLQFTVWGNVAGKSSSDIVALYGDSGALVKGSGVVETLYTCDVTRYWTPSCDFNFAAIVNGSAKTVVDGMPTVISYTAAGDNDLLYASATAETDAQGTPSGTGTATIAGATTPVVAFTFNHLLSRIAFKYTVAADVDSAYTYNVTNVKVAGGYKTGVCTPEGVWSEQTGTMPELTFADIENDAFVIIPGAPALTISFTAEVVFGGKVISTKDYTKTLNTDADSDADDFTFAKNTAYSFNVVLPKPGEEIMFSITTVDNFGTGSEVNVQ